MSQRDLEELGELARALEDSGLEAQAAWLARERAQAALEMHLDSFEPPDWDRDLRALPGWTTDLGLDPDGRPLCKPLDGLSQELARELWRLSESLERSGAVKSSRRLRILALYLEKALAEKHREPVLSSKAYDMVAEIDLGDLAEKGYPFEATAFHVAGDEKYLRVQDALTDFGGRAKVHYGLLEKIAATQVEKGLVEDSSAAEQWARVNEATLRLSKGAGPTMYLSDKPEGYHHEVDPGPESPDDGDGGTDKGGPDKGGPDKEAPDVQTEEHRAEEHRSDESGSRQDEQARFLFRLEGDRAKGGAVELGADFDLRFDYAAPRADDLARVGAEKLEEMRREGLEFRLTLHAPGFSFRDGVFSRLVRFEGGRLADEVIFQMTAPDEAPEKGLRIWVRASRDGRAFYEAPLELEGVESLDEAEGRPPVDIDLDSLRVAFSGRFAPRQAVLMLSAEGAKVSVTAFVGDSSVFGSVTEWDRGNLIDVLGRAADIVLEGLGLSLWSRLPDGGLDMDVTDRESAAKCRDLMISAGHELWDFLCQDDTMRQALELIDALPDGSSVDLRTDRLFLPWEILHPPKFHHSWPEATRQRNGGPQPQRLWGYRFHLENRLHGQRREDGSPPSGGDGPTLIRLNLDPSIDSQKANKTVRPVDSHRRLVEKIDENELDFAVDGDEIYGRLLQDDDDATLIYFYCHGISDRPFDPRSSEVLKLGSRVDVKPGALDIEARFAKKPLVVLNSCDSGAFSALRFSNFLSVFEKRGACGLVATNFAVPSHFGAAFGRRLLEDYAAGEKTVGEIVHGLRRELLERGHPLGLLYTLQCPLEAKAPGPNRSSGVRGEDPRKDVA